MKLTISYTSLASVLLMAMLLCMPTGSVQAQENDEELEFDYSFEFSTLKNADNSRTLEVSFYGESGRDTYPVYDAKIDFFNLLDDEEVLLGSVQTDKEGKSTLTLKKETTFVKDEEGYITFVARFDGTDNIESFEEELTVKDVRLTMELSEEGDYKTITVYMNMINADGTEEPVEETDIYFYVQSMINKMPIYDDWLEEGEYVYEFEEELPGDQDGNLTFYVRIEDNDDFGNVIQSATAKWGSGPMVTEAKRRSLWSDLAPQWMMVVLSVVLVLVWANIIHALYSLARIKRESQVE